MKFSSVIALSLNAAFLLAANSFAASFEDCAHKTTTIAIVDCHTARHAAADKKLNAVYAAAMQHLPPDARSRLKTSQQAWLKFRDANEAFVQAMNKDVGTYANVVVTQSRTSLLESRLDELEAILQGPGDRPSWLP